MNDDDFLTAAGQAIQYLESLDPSEYWPSKLPSPEDRRIAEVCDLYVEATPTQRQVFASSLTRRMCGVLASFATRMAMLSVRERSETMLLRGLIALIITLDSPWGDLRDALWYDLPLLYHSADKLSADPNRLFHTAAQYAVKQLVKDIVGNPKVSSTGDGLLKKIGWEETYGPSGLIYRRKGEPIPKGHL